MITGRINEQLEAIVSLRVLSGKAERSVDAVIDTGFNGFLTLPRGVIRDLGLEFESAVPAELADGSLVTFRRFVAAIKWNESGDENREVLVLEAEGAALAGMSLLEWHRLTMDVVEGGSVTIQRR